jgi:hypothetical protein
VSVLRGGLEPPTWVNPSGRGVAGCSICTKRKKQTRCPRNRRGVSGVPKKKSVKVERGAFRVFQAAPPSERPQDTQPEGEAGAEPERAGGRIQEAIAVMPLAFLKVEASH